MRNGLVGGIVMGLAIGAASCVNVHVDPIYAKVDVNIKVDQELDSFFDDVQKKQGAAAPAVPVQPAPPTSQQGDSPVKE